MKHEKTQLAVVDLDAVCLRTRGGCDADRCTKPFVHAGEGRGDKHGKANTYSGNPN